MRASAHVGRSPRDGSGHAEPTEQTRGDVGDPLSNQLTIGSMTASGHAVRDDGGQDGLNGSQQRKSECVGQHGLDLGETDLEYGRGGKAAGYPAELCSYGESVTF